MPSGEAPVLRRRSTRHRSIQAIRKQLLEPHVTAQFMQAKAADGNDEA